MAHRERRKTLAKNGIVRVDFPANRSYSKMIVDFTISVQEFRELIREKMKHTHNFGFSEIELANDPQLFDSYGLFVPPTENFSGEWMKGQDPLNFYYIQQRGSVQFRLKPKPLQVILNLDFFAKSQVKLPPLVPTSGTLTVDYTQTVGNLTPQVITYFFKTDDFLLGGGRQWLLINSLSKEILDPKLNLQQQGLPENVPVILAVTRGNAAFNQRIANLAQKTKNFVSEGTEKLKTLRGKEASSSVTSATQSNTSSQTNTYQSPKAKGLVFGVPLPEQPPDAKLVEKCITYITNRALDLEGIFRLSGSQGEMNNIRKEYQEGNFLDLETIADPHTVCGIMKMFFREMPEPLFPFHQYEALTQVHKSVVPAVRPLYYAVLVVNLPRANRLMLIQLLTFFLKVCEHSQQNKMTVNNLATCFATNLIRPLDSGPLMSVDETALVNNVMGGFIGNAQTIMSLAEGLTSQRQDVCQIGDAQVELFEPTQVIGICQAVYPYESENRSDLPFSEGALILITQWPDESWWSGALPEKADSSPAKKFVWRQGLLPSNYVELLIQFETASIRASKKMGSKAPPVLSSGASSGSSLLSAATTPTLSTPLSSSSPSASLAGPAVSSSPPASGQGSFLQSRNIPTNIPTSNLAAAAPSSQAYGAGPIPVNANTARKNRNITINGNDAFDTLRQQDVAPTAYSLKPSPPIKATPLPKEKPLALSTNPQLAPSNPSPVNAQNSTPLSNASVVTRTILPNKAPPTARPKPPTIKADAPSPAAGPTLQKKPSFLKSQATGASSPPPAANMHTNVNATASTTGSPKPNSTKSKFNNELEILRQNYETERQARVELELLTQQLLEKVMVLKNEVDRLNVSNKQLLDFVAKQK